MTHYHWDEEAGRRGLEDAVRFCKEYEGDKLSLDIVEATHISKQSSELREKGLYEIQ